MSGDDFLRDAVSRAGDGIGGGDTPTDLAGRLEQGRARLVRRRMATRAAAGAAVVLLVGAVVLQFGRDDGSAVETVDVPDSSTPTVVSTTVTSAVTTETTAPISTTTVPPTTVATTTSEPTTTAALPAVTPIGPSTPITLYGIGAVVVGMTVAEAEAITGQPFEVVGTEDFGDTCRVATVQGLEGLGFLVYLPAPGSDRGEAVVSEVYVSAPPWRTLSGIGIGSTRSEVLDVYGPERIVESVHDYDIDGRRLYLDYTSTDPAESHLMVRFSTEDDVVTDISAGERGSVTMPEGCI